MPYRGGGRLKKNEACVYIENLEGVNEWKVFELREEVYIFYSTCVFTFKILQMVKFKSSRTGSMLEEIIIQLEGVYLCETCAHVVHWNIVRILLVLEISLELKSK